MGFFFNLIFVVVLLGGTLLYLNFDRLVNYVAQILVDASKMDIESIEITQCDDTGFLISLVAKIYDTGPVDAIITDMKLSMFSTKNGNAFAKVALPTINANPAGTTCKVVEQRVEILDFEAFHTFSKNLLLQGELPAYVRGNGKLTIPWPVRLSTVVKYEKVEVLPGLNGVQIDVLETRKASRSLLKGKPTEIEVDVCITSQSPVAIEMGATEAVIVFSGMRIATVRANLFLKPGENKITFNGEMDFLSIGRNLGTGIKFLKKDAVDADGAVAYVKGSKGEQCGWLDDTVKLMNSRIVMGDTMSDLISSIYNVEESAA